MANRTTVSPVTVWSSTPRVAYSARPVTRQAANGRKKAKLDIY